MKLLTDVDIELIVGGDSKAYMAGAALATALKEDNAYLAGVGEWWGSHIYDWTH